MSKALSTTIFAVLFALAFALAFAAAVPVAADEDSSPTVPTVIELFTSQGCGACPPANSYVLKLAKRENIFVLSWNVDYWDYKGWTDTLARPESAERQRSYNERLGRPGVYTPEMVIQGSHHLRGSDRVAVEELLARISSKPRPRADIELARGERGVSIQIGEHGQGTRATECDIVLVQYGFSRTVPIRAGDNDGLTVTYTNIVEKAETIGTWDGAPLALDIDAGKLGAEGNVILLQEGAGGPILGMRIIPPGS